MLLLSSYCKCYHLKTFFKGLACRSKQGNYDFLFQTEIGVASNKAKNTAKTL